MNQPSNGAPPTGSPAAFGTAATIGKRDIQEDAIGWSRDRLDQKGELPALIIIADGMGGHAAGEVASRLAVNGFLDAYRREPASAPMILADALDWANGQLAGHVAAHPETDGMGCTIVAVEINPEATAYRWISVGDSLLLSVTPTGIDRLNADHSYREERERLIAAGENPDLAPSANVLRSALMGFDVPLIDHQSEWRPLQPGETLILATDGLDTLNPEQVRVIAHAHDTAAEIAAALVAAVDSVGKPRQDNTSVAVIRPPALHPEELGERTLPPIAAAPVPEPEPKTQPPVPLSALDAEAIEPPTRPVVIDKTEKTLFTPGGGLPEEERTQPPAPRVLDSIEAETAQTLPPTAQPLPLPKPVQDAPKGSAIRRDTAAKVEKARKDSAKAKGGRGFMILLIVLLALAIGAGASWFGITRYGHLLPPALQPGGTRAALPAAETTPAPAPAPVQPTPAPADVPPRGSTPTAAQSAPAQPAAAPPTQSTQAQPALPPETERPGMKLASPPTPRPAAPASGTP